MDTRHEPRSPSPLDLDERLARLEREIDYLRHRFEGLAGSLNLVEQELRSILESLSE